MSETVPTRFRPEYFVNGVSVCETGIPGDQGRSHCDHPYIEVSSHSNWTLSVLVDHILVEELTIYMSRFLESSTIFRWSLLDNWSYSFRFSRHLDS